MKNNVCGHETRLLAEGAGLIGMGRIELELFSRLDLDRLMRTPGLRLDPRGWVRTPGVGLGPQGVG